LAKREVNMLRSLDDPIGTQALPMATAPGDVFMRFTAYSNDRRNTSEKGLLPGTYATTEEDSRVVATGEQAVERYALPNPTPPCTGSGSTRQPGRSIRQVSCSPPTGTQGAGSRCSSLSAQREIQ
jgi:hypothetical protein